MHTRHRLITVLLTALTLCLALTALADGPLPELRYVTAPGDCEQDRTAGCLDLSLPEPALSPVATPDTAAARLAALGVEDLVRASWAADDTPMHCAAQAAGGRTCIGIAQLCHMLRYAHAFAREHVACDAPAVASAPD
jgi:hypothetical protein